MNIKVLLTIVVSIALTGGAIAYKVANPDSASPALHNADQTTQSSSSNGLTVAETSNLTSNVLNEADPLVDCIFPYSGTATLKKSQCESALECQIGSEWKATTIAQCQEYYQGLQKEASSTPIQMKYRSPSMRKRPSSNALLKDDCYAEWESYFRRNPVNQPSFLDSMGLPGPCQ